MLSGIVYIPSLLYLLFEKENMNGHAVTRIYFQQAYILMEKLDPQLDLLRTPAPLRAS